jgi:hypothetical protein
MQRQRGTRCGGESPAPGVGSASSTRARQLTPQAWKKVTLYLAGCPFLLPSGHPKRRVRRPGREEVHDFDAELCSGQTHAAREDPRSGKAAQVLWRRKGQAAVCGSKRSVVPHRPLLTVARKSQDAGCALGKRSPRALFLCSAAGPAYGLHRSSCSAHWGG